MSSFKRARSPQRQDDSPSPSPTPSPTFKAARTSATPPPGAGEPSTSSHILCTLPPTCNPPNRPTSLGDTRELEAHYAMYHAHVCEDPGCGCVFPDERLLELAHGYPKEYFFAVTNKGVGGLLKRWGEGASLLRRPWQPREKGNADEDDDEDEDGTATDATQVQSANGGGVLSDDDEEQILLEKMPVDRPARASTTAANGPPASPAKGKGRETRPSEEDNTLADAMDSLSLVPSSVQFGRGAKRGGRGHVARGGGARGTGRGAFANGGGEGAPMQLDFRPPNVRGRGRGAGRGFHVPRGGGFPRGRGNGPRGFGRGAMLGGGVVRGAGPGRGVAKGNINA
ncbi:hypothetical protein TRAPUB_13754 [Trametes pubescens]|uniref:C2H2-type domain-containing protein n=1 Tax=Trametes pubescens TaxID=154538 RepID=A0A1M2VQC4_TRAPU|nr:hypothetical protein TRAPUB_13754 [Trametes pubescens]